MIYKRPGTTATGCLGNLPNGDVCGAHTGGAFDLCADCTTRTHNTLMVTLYRHGMQDLARDLNAHYLAAHSPAKRGGSCPDCFREGHRRTFTNTGVRVPPHAIVKA